MVIPDRQTFLRLAVPGTVIPLRRRILSDQLTPVLAYRRLVAADDRTAPSFLLESVETDGRVGRYSFVGAQPSIEVIARRTTVEIIDHRSGTTTTEEHADPLALLRRLAGGQRCIDVTGGEDLPAFLGGWVGYAGYDTARWLEPEKLTFDAAPPDDRSLPDLHFGQYRQVGVFDHVEKILHAVVYVVVDEHDSPEDAWEAGTCTLDGFTRRLQAHSVELPAGTIDLDLGAPPDQAGTANITDAAFEAAVERCRTYIADGDAFQIVLSRRIERQTTADPFEIYRALRVVNPSPYMIYLQAADTLLVASSPEILCRVSDTTVVNRPLAGTRRRGRTADEDAAFEAELRGDAKECAEHVMLVDLGRNDLSTVCEATSIDLPSVLDIERYRHVMHLSSTITGRLRPDMDCWDALRHALPVGTVSGAPKVRAMQIIDELEPTRRGPYAGGIGWVSFKGDMDIAIALRTMVMPTRSHDESGWTVHLQAGAGIVLDSVPAHELRETQSKAASLGRAIDLAESAFGAG